MKIQDFGLRPEMGPEPQNVVLGGAPTLAQNGRASRDSPGSKSGFSARFGEFDQGQTPRALHVPGQNLPWGPISMEIGTSAKCRR